jgi:hypothetical protein
MRWIAAALTYGAIVAAPCREIAAGRIRASDLAAANPAFGVADGSRDIGPAPLAGVRRVFRTAELKGLARQLGMKLDADAPDICFERTAQTLTAETLHPILEAALGSPAEILDFSRNPVPAGKIEFPKAFLSVNGVWRGRIVSPEGKSTPIWVRLPASAAVFVQRGDGVKVEVATGGVLLSFAASAETSGRMGEMVTITNPFNGRRLQARVIDKGKVSIQK